MKTLPCKAVLIAFTIVCNHLLQNNLPGYKILLSLKKVTKSYFENVSICKQGAWPNLSVAAFGFV